MLPVIALVGRPNVGKSTLFNFLTRTRDALVADMPGLTRDRNYGYGKVGMIPYVVVDTGGLVVDAQGVEQHMVKQALRAVQEADRVLFLVDSRSGITPDDHYIAQTLRKLNKKVFLVANKAEGVDSATAGADFYSLGLGEPRAISATHGDNVRTVVDEALEGIELAAGAAAAGGQDDIRVAVIGRPNVGKSTLINRLLGEERLIAFDQPGTTRDAVFVPFERDGHTYTLIDTAGVRRRARVEEAIEKFSVIKALQAVDSANVVIGVIDAHDAVAEQDASLFGLVAERGRALLIAVNKWDGIQSDKRDEIRAGLDLRLPFLDFAPIHFISALHGTGVGELMRGVKHAYDAAMRDMATPELTECWRRPWNSTNRRWCAAVASSCDMRIKAAATRPSSWSTATRFSTCRMHTNAIWRMCSARTSAWKARRCAWSSAATRTRSRPNATPRPRASAALQPAR